MIQVLSIRRHALWDGFSRSNVAGHIISEPKSCHDANLSSLMAPQIVIMQTTCGATRDDKVGIFDNSSFLVMVNLDYFTISIDCW